MARTHSYGTAPRESFHSSRHWMLPAAQRVADGVLVILQSSEGQPAVLAAAARVRHREPRLLDWSHQRAGGHAESTACGAHLEPTRMSCAGLRDADGRDVYCVV